MASTQSKWLAAVTGALVSGACATPDVIPPTDVPLVIRDTPQQPREALYTAPPAQSFDGKQMAADSVTPVECMKKARMVREVSANDGWALLTACIRRGEFPHGNFVDARLLLDGTWDADLASRPDAPDVIAALVALRGGDIDADLKLFQEKRVPIYSLGAAIAQPETFRGRMLLVRASIKEVKNAPQAITARLDETKVKAEMTEFEAPGVRRHYTDSSTTSYTTHYATPNGPAHETTTVTSSRDRSTHATVVYEDNTSLPTGNEALGKLPQADPFLETGREFVFLARFDGTRTTSHPAEDDTPPEVVALLTIQKYYTPSAVLAY